MICIGGSTEKGHKAEAADANALSPSFRSRSRPSYRPRGPDPAQTADPSDGAGPASPRASGSEGTVLRKIELRGLVHQSAEPGNQVVSVRLPLIHEGP